jgi:hypothetical protein
MLKQQANRIYNRVELRNPTYNDNPPTVPYIWLNGLTGELFSCTDNTTDLNVWVGTSTGTIEFTG